MSITGSLQIKRDRYHVVYRDDKGNLKWKTTGITVGKTKKEQKANYESATLAKMEILKAAEEEMELAKLAETHKFFTDYLEEWLDHEKNYIKYSTYEGYKKMLNGKILPYFQKKKYFVNDITTEIVEKYLIYMKNHGRVKSAGGLKLKSLKNIYSFLNSAMKDATDNSIIDYNPVEKAKLPRYDDIENGKKSAVYSSEQIKELLLEADKADNCIKLFIYLDAITGARRGELLGLTWEDIDFDKKMINIRRNRVATDKENLDLLTTPKTDSSNRCIYLPQSIIELLQDERQRQDKFRELFAEDYKEYKNDFVLRYENGQIPYPSSVSRAVKRVMSNAGLPIIRVHDIRHSVASILFNFVSVKEVSVILGHSTTRITEDIYIHRNNVTPAETTSALAEHIGL